MKHGFEYKKMSFSANNGGNIPKQLSDFVNAKPWCKDMYDMCIALAYVSNLDALFEEARLWHEDIHCHVFKKKSFYAAMTHSNFATAKENFNHTAGFRQRQLMWYDPGIGEIAIFFVFSSTKQCPFTCVSCLIQLHSAQLRCQSEKKCINCYDGVVREYQSIFQQWQVTSLVAE